MIKIFGKTYTSFNEWFFYKSHPHSRINGHRLLMDSLWLVAFIILFLLFYNNSILFNQIVILIIKLGAIIQLILSYFIIVKTYYLVINLKNGFLGMRNGYKAGCLLIFILICSVIYANQETFTNWSLNLYENFDFSSFNPFKVN